jgi:hypothetical protein
MFGIDLAKWIDFAGLSVAYIMLILVSLGLILYAFEKREEIGRILGSILKLAIIFALASLTVQVLGGIGVAIIVAALILALAILRR